MNKKNILIAIWLIIGLGAESFAINEPLLENALTLTFTAENTGCGNDPSGSATVEVKGGIYPYTYKWSNGGTTATIKNLIAGNYFVTVTDAKGLKKNGHVWVEATNVLKLKIDQKELKCANDTNGRIQVTPKAGVGPYTYEWSTGATKSYIDNLGEGMYMVTVTDANGCRGEERIMFMAPNPLRIKAHYAHISCGESADGFMQVIASGGTAPYTFVWELDGKGGTERSNLKPGLYSVTVTDANGCTNMICPEIRDAKPPSLVYSSYPETCPGEGNGQATITPNGDSPPYRIEWPEGVHAQHVNAYNLTKGIYTVTVTNFRNCSATIDVEIGQAGGGFGFVLESNGIACGGEAGKAAVIMKGGVAPFKYEWKNEDTGSIISNNKEVNDLTPGNYSVLVSDANGCFGKRDLLIAAKPAPNVEVMAIKGAVCFGEKTGAAFATATGGEGVYTYKWSNGVNGDSIANLSGGIYTVTVMDGNGCTDTKSIEIMEYPPLAIAEKVTNIECFEEPGGRIVANASGGAGGYTYLWSNGATTNAIQDLKAGTYFVTATDSVGCQISKGINIEQPPKVVITVETENAADLMTNNGKILVTVTGGTAPYSYEWSNGATTKDLIDVPAGTYQLKVTDANGCMEMIEEVIVEATCTLMAAITDVRSTKCAANDGAVTVSITGAKGAVSYLWSNGATSSAIAGIGAGNYGVTVQDANGCEAIANAFVKDTCGCETPIIEKILVHETACGKNEGSIDIKIKGNIDDFDLKWSDSAITGERATGLASGTYKVTISDKKDAQCSITEVIHIGVAEIGPIIESKKAPEICNKKNGTITLVPGGLTYQWSDGGTGSAREDLVAGSYEVTVTNPSLEGCEEVITVKIGLENGLTLKLINVKYPDCGISNGSATIGVEGGSGNYEYSWGAATRENLPSGFYEVTVTDKSTNCRDTIQFTLLEKMDAKIIIDSIKGVSCVGGEDGFVLYSLTDTGNIVKPLSISIEDKNGKAHKADALAAGNYCIIARDGNNCVIGEGEACFTITEPELLLVNVSILPKTCSRENSICLNSSGGKSPYTYNWRDMNGEINPRDRKNIENGTYFVTVTDRNGCSIADSINIEGECFVCKLEVEYNIVDIPECGLPNGSVNIKVDSFIGNLRYKWSGKNDAGTFLNDSTINSFRSDLLAGTYEVTIIDDYRGCDTTVSFPLTEDVLSKEAAISELIVCPDETGKLNYNISNFKCAKQPLSVIITDEEGNNYDENALKAFSNYIFIVKDADGEELNRQAFSVQEYDRIITSSSTTDEGCDTLGTIDLNLAKPIESYSIKWDDLTGSNQTANRKGLKAATYRVTIADEWGCTITKEFTINKNTDISADLAPEILTCDGAPVELHLEGTDLTSYIWTPIEKVGVGQGTAKATINIGDEADTTVIAVIAKNKLGCIIEKETKIISIKTSLPEGIGIERSPQCDSLTVAFSIPDGLHSYYIWDFGDGNQSEEANPSHTYDKAGDYTVQLKLEPGLGVACAETVVTSRTINLVENAQTTAKFEIKYDACTDEGQVQFMDASISTPGTINSWNWDFGNGLTSTAQNPVVTLDKDEELQVKLSVASDIGCSDATITEQHAFKVIKMPKMLDSLRICPGVPTELNPDPVLGLKYEWTPSELLDDPMAANPMVTTSKPVDFIVKITQGECVRQDLVKANVPSEQEYQLSEDEIVCDTAARLLTIEAPTTSRIEWKQGDEIISKEATFMAKPGAYTVKLTDVYNCVVTDEVVIENFQINALIDNGTDPCEGGIGLLEVINNTAEPITSYQWQDAEGIISPDLDKSSIEVEPAATTEYFVTIKNEFGCTDTLSQKVSVSNLEPVIAKAERDTIFNGEFTAINVSPIGDYIVEWTNNASLDKTNVFKPVASPEETTTYTVTVTDTATNCNIIREVMVFVKQVNCAEPNIFFPNAFSPNGDGVNDVLYIRGNAITEATFTIYNRWGEQVFESKSLDMGWDGTYNGQLVEPDVYGYRLRVVCFDGEVFEKQGNVTVLR
jgi:gliding motility-associated-like protein